MQKQIFSALITGLIDDELSRVDTQENIIPPNITLCTLLYRYYTRKSNP